MNQILFLILCSFVLSTALTPAFRQFALWRNWVDPPDTRRKMHKIPMARIGGVPILLAYASALGMLSLPGRNFSLVDQSEWLLVWAILPSAVLVLITGLLDDIVGLKPWQKLIGQTLAAGLVAFHGIRIQSVGGHPVGAIVAVLMTTAWIVGCTNAFNLIDGLDGLAAGIGLIASITSLVVGLLRGDFGLVIATAPLVGALAGFLLFNFNPASIFLGDSGSLWVGFMLACYGIIWCQKSVTMLSITAPMMVMCIPLLDTGLSIARRFLRSEPIFRADRGHIHHRLLDRGLTPRRATLLLYGASSVGAIFSILQSTASNRIRALVIGTFCLMVLLGIAKLGYQEFGIVTQLLRRKTFQSLVRTQLSLNQYEILLNSATTVEECWNRLRAVASELGFSEIELKLGGVHYQEQFCQSANGNWTLHVPVSESEYVRFLCHFEFATIAPLIAPWADLLHRCLPQKAAAFAQPAMGSSGLQTPELEGV